MSIIDIVQGILAMFIAASFIYTGQSDIKQEDWTYPKK